MEHTGGHTDEQVALVVPVPEELAAYFPGSVAARVKERFLTVLRQNMAVEVDGGFISVTAHASLAEMLSTAVTAVEETIAAIGTTPPR